MSFLSKHKSPFLAVLQREWDRMTSRRLYFGVCIILPLFCVFFMSTIFGSGQMENIPIGIVDLDNSATSREITRSISSIPTFKVTKHFSDLASAKKATQETEIYGYLLIPSNFESDMFGGRDATLSYYYHFALLSVGSEIYGAFESFLQTLSISPIVTKATAMGVEQQQIKTFLVPVQTESHPLFNPSLDYSIYLTQPFFFVLFQVLILLVTIYVLGSEIKFKTATQWLETANMNIFIATIGKLLPYSIIFSIIGIFANYIFFGVLNIPHSADLLPINLSTILFIVATQSLALFIFSITPIIELTMSTLSMIGSLGATLAGVTFPITSMYPVVHYASYLFPIRHFVEISQNLLYGNYGFANTWQNVSALLIFPLLALVLQMRLQKAILGHKYESAE